VKKLLVFMIAAPVFTPAAFAQETMVERLLALSRDANGECRKAQLPGPALEAACRSARAYDEALGELGFCFDADAGEWRGCALAGRPAGRDLDEPSTEIPERQSTVTAPEPAPVEEYVAPPAPPAEQPSEDERRGEPAPGDFAERQAGPEAGAETPPEAAGQVPQERWASAEAGEWRTYFNPRFGTAAEIPAWQFQPGTDIDDGEGQTFVSADGESDIAVYATMLEGEDFGAYRDWYRSELSGVSYEAGGRNWFVISGRADGKIYYVKAVQSRRCGVGIAHHVVLRYPVSLKRRFDPVVERLAGSLRGATPQGYCG
jgi:hypothetical protein